MKNKGFTLIELIGTVVILSLLLIIIVPAIGDKLKKGREAAEQQTKNNIILGAKNYVSDHPDTSCVDLETLQQQGYLDYKIKSPTDETKEITDVKIRVQTSTTSTGKIKRTYFYEDGKC
ncbi:MAG: prepilin-type N-terminal cleavage/methylation domain-containing protein [Bacilli bacterium]|nr:prepilin-type N-terminal cleavage/methylation domain-containing protein [Bacilli bacterium]